MFVMESARVNNSSTQPASHFWAFLVLVAFANFAGAELCDWLSVGLGPVAGVWLPGGISLAVVLRSKPGRWLPLVLASMAIYAAGIALNDWFDYAIDQRRSES